MYVLLFGRRYVVFPFFCLLFLSFLFWPCPGLFFLFSLACCSCLLRLLVGSFLVCLFVALCVVVCVFCRLVCLSGWPVYCSSVPVFPHHPSFPFLFLFVWLFFLFSGPRSLSLFALCDFLFCFFSLLAVLCAYVVGGCSRGVVMLCLRCLCLLSLLSASSPKGASAHVMHAALFLWCSVLLLLVRLW